jgi:hypothetical protein
MMRAIRLVSGPLVDRSVLTCFWMEVWSDGKWHNGLDAAGRSLSRDVSSLCRFPAMRGHDDPAHPL